MEFRRQPTIIRVDVTQGDLVDIEEASQQIQQFLEGRYASTLKFRTEDGIAILVYPFAVND